MEIGKHFKVCVSQVEMVEMVEMQDRFCNSSSFRALTVIFLESNSFVFPFFVNLAFESLKFFDFDWGSPLESLKKFE